MAKTAWLCLVAAGCASDASSGGTEPAVMQSFAGSAAQTTGSGATMQTTGADAGRGGSMAPTTASSTMPATTTTTTTTAMGGSAGAAAEPNQGGMDMHTDAAGTSGAAAGASGLDDATAEAGRSGMDAAAGSMAMPVAGSDASDAGSDAMDMGSAGSAGADASDAMDMDMGTDTTEHEDLGMGDSTDVVLIGDSWMSNTLQFEGTGGGIAPSLISFSKQRYRNYGLQGVMLLMADSFGPAIPSQWDDAKRDNADIKTVVMTAGGNDIIQGSSTLQGSCQMGTDECKQKLIEISNALDELWTQMAEDGVQDIVHIRYTDNTGTLHPSLQGSKGLPVPSICLSGKVRCHAVETTDIVAATDLAVDGIHPLQSANDRIAKRTFELMTSEGMRR